MEKIILIIVGLAVGSFLNVVIYRLPKGESIVKPGSHCPKCNTPIKFYDNIPVISYIFLWGKCRQCKTHIPFIYPAVEILTALIFWYSYTKYSPFSPVYTGFAILFLCLLLVLALIDLQHMILPLELTIGGAAVFLIYSFFNPVLTPIDAFATALSSALVFAGIYYFYIKVRKIEGLGQGDIWLMLFLGAFLGVNKTVIAVLVGSLSGLVVGLYFIIFHKKNLKLALPFGTFLGLGSGVSLFWGNAILRWIQSLYR